MRTATSEKLPARWPGARGLVLYADGACEPNPGTGGWGFVAYQDGREVHYECGGSPTATNNSMELRAALMALRWLASRDPAEPAILRCDSQYVVRGCNDWRHGWKRKGWRRGNAPLANAEIWRELDAALFGLAVTLEWVRGHSGISGNERADALAATGREKALRTFRGRRAA